MPRLVPDFILERFACGEMKGQMTAVSLSVDVSGFTPLTESLFKYHTDGAEILGRTLNEIFGPLVREVGAAGGVIPLYAGDAFTAVFPLHPGQESEAAARILSVARQMQGHFAQNGRTRRFNTLHGDFEIGIRVGLAYGPVRWGIPGRDNQYTFYFRGLAIQQAVYAQKQGSQGTLVIHPTFTALLTKEAWNGKDQSLLILQPGPGGAPPLSGSQLQSPAAIDPAHLRPFIPTAVLNLAVEAEFRAICPLFIRFDVPDDDQLLHDWTADVMFLISRYGGTFGQLEFNDEGGIIVAWFGAPISYENNALRAVQCLIALGRKNSSQSPIWRAGLTYGLVWSGLRGAVERVEYGAIGDVVNTASRIAEMAEPGQIWLDQPAALRIEQNYQLDQLGLYRMRGKKAAVPLYQLMAPKSQLNIMFRGNMVGREAELEALMLAVSPIFRGEFGGFSVIFGDAGMGKSRLVFELQQQLARWVTWAFCPSEEILRQSFNPFRKFLLDYFFQTPQQTDEAKKESFDIVLGSLLESLEVAADPRTAEIRQELHRTRSLLAALIDLYWPDSLYELLPPKLRSENTFTALTNLFKAISLQGPLIIHLEDTHWLDRDSRRLLVRFSSELQKFPLAFIKSSRYLEDGSQPLLAEVGDALRTVIHLESLSPAGVQKIAEQLLNRTVEDDVVNLLIQKSNGQPFFAEQIILDLRESGMLNLESGRYKLAPNSSDYLPSSLNAVLVTRLDRLSPAVRQVVQVASILGERFTVPVLAAILNEDKELIQNVQTAADKQIWTMVDELRYLFKHALLRDAAYYMQLHSHRRHLHLVAAQTFEKLYQPNLKPYYHEIAHHYFAAYELGLESVKDYCCYYLIKAGEQAFENYEHVAAIRYLSIALSLATTWEFERPFNILKLREHIYGIRNDRSKQYQDLQQLSRIATLSRRKDWQIEVAHLFSNYASHNNDYNRAIGFGRQAIQIAKEFGDIRHLAASYLNYARANIWRRHFIAAQEPLNQARAIAAEYGLQEIEGEVLRDLGYITAQLGDYEQGKAYVEQALVINRRMGNRTAEYANLNNLGGMYLDQGYFSKAHEHITACLEINREIGHRTSAAICLNGLGELACRIGRYERAAEHFEEALVYYREGENQRLEISGLYWLGLSRLYLGEHQSARQHLERALRLALENSADKGDAHYGMGLMLYTLGDDEEAAEHLEKAVELRHKASYTALALEATAILAKIADRNGRQEEAQCYLKQILDYLEQGGTLDGTEAPFRIYLTCYQLLHPSDPEKAEALLEDAYQKLIQQAERVEDEDGRESLLQNVPWHKEIIALHQ